MREKLLVLVKDLAMDGLSGYFRLPVRESEAPNYSALVKHPADLDSIANRIMYEVFSLSLSLSLSRTLLAGSFGRYSLAVRKDVESR